MNKNPNPKIKEIIPKIDGLKATDFLALRTENGPKGSLILTYQLPFLGEMVCNQTLNDPAIIKWIDSSTFDLVVIDGLYNDCGMSFCNFIYFNF